MIDSFGVDTMAMFHQINHEMCGCYLMNTFHVYRRDNESNKSV